MSVDLLRSQLRRSDAKKETYLFFILDDSPKLVTRFATFACDDSRVPYRDVEATPENTIHRGNRVRDVVFLSLSMPSRDVDIDALVVLARRDTEGGTRDLCSDLINTAQFERSAWT